MVSFNLTIGTVEPHHLSQCLNPADDLDGVFFHPELPVQVNKQLLYYQSSSRIYIKSQDNIIRIQTVAQFFAVRSTIRHLSNSQSVKDNVGVSILTKLKRLSTLHQIHLQWIPSHIDLEGNEMADTFAMAGTCEPFNRSSVVVERKNFLIDLNLEKLLSPLATLIGRQSHKTATISSARPSAFISGEFPSVNTVSRSLQHFSSSF
ncbi:uncharacterized protein TNCV_3189561 [Trichonephila clavipes]|nr:uncharacterized protein TNCV_3189561 [Trichonephila clavipes]